MFLLFFSDEFDFSRPTTRNSVLLNGEALDSQHHAMDGGDYSDSASLDSVPATELLDVSASKSKATLATSGSLKQRRPPTKSAVSFKIDRTSRTGQNISKKS